MSEQIEAIARSEWARNVDNCRSNYNSEKVYVAYRKVEAGGRIKGSIQRDEQRNSAPVVDNQAIAAAAERDWATNKDGCRGHFSSARAMTGYRTAQARGAIRE